MNTVDPLELYSSNKDYTPETKSNVKVYYQRDDDLNSLIDRTIATDAIIKKASEQKFFENNNGSVTATVGQILINSKLPKKMRDYNRVLDKRGLRTVMQTLANDYPEKYKDVGFQIKKLGDRESIYSFNHLKYSDIEQPLDLKPYLSEAKKMVQKQVQLGTPRDIALVDSYSKIKKKLTTDALAAGVKKDKTLAVMVATGSRGKPAQYADTVAAPLLVSDFSNRPIDLINGKSYSVLDKYNIGKYLAKDTGKYRAGTELTPEILSDLKDKETIVIRSPITCEADVGICKKCLGNTELGVPQIGYNAGINSAAAITEPLTQGMLSEKHTGGAVKKRVGGFPLLKKLIESPKNFPDRAILSETHGKVKAINKLPWGGSKIMVNDEEHLVAPDLAINVKVGQDVERGEQLTDGVLRPSDVVRLRGLGEGRRALAQELQNTFEDMNIDIDRAHYELASKSLVDFGKAKQNIGGVIEGELATLNHLKKNVKFNNVVVSNTENVPNFGRYLAKPALHYSIGTELTPMVKKDLINNGYDRVHNTQEQLPFEPKVIRVQDTASTSKDWMHRLSSQGLKKSLLTAAQSGYRSKVTSPSYVHAYTRGITFGKDIKKGRY
jgi:hypothetical protein